MQPQFYHNKDPVKGCAKFVLWVQAKHLAAQFKQGKHEAHVYTAVEGA